VDCNPEQRKPPRNADFATSCTPLQALHSWHLMVGGVFYLAFLVAAVFAVI
jgi:hypothetical protein